MPTEIITAALMLATVIAENIGKFYDGASPEQKVKLVQFQIDFHEWLANLIKVKP